MRKLILQHYMSLDGYIADKEGGVGFIAEYAALGDRTYIEDAEASLDSVDTLLLGAKTYKLLEAYWPHAGGAEARFAEKLNALQKVVVSNRLERAPWGSFPAATLVADPVAAASELKQGTGASILVWGSVSVAQRLLNAGLVDEIQVRLCPCVLGEGHRLFDAPQWMELTETHRFEHGMLRLCYRPRSA
ncbi:deaminase [Natronospirillum operosum]|uniref:Deaminase n=1 Tax=Natronospirillum operosum TaxID=2759953 RepID=A0A4Z0WB61_9GAMM|nr:dihydrofolate reductase family protein [Natronospirillum operosum]TGG91700.1 deaminase [Natronospirillum operosum]